ncbi:unnamed protein product [Ceutorhynchus assimilis]|uniref:Uncharacterized protein n=1 Tax=Ceutorhynchus assimilis TaxID=467358 RepID=A0A9N9MU08_9CUCU|nr:unnamed protein product [Ceutorhynchus assimilis]
MKSFILTTAILGFASCGRLDSQYLPAINRGLSTPVSGQFSSAASHNQVPIVKYINDNNGEGTYRYNYETANSISAEEHGDARGAQGSYSYISPEGEHVSVSYTADENGYVAHGSHLPTPPPIPEAILKSIQENAAAEARGIFNEGSYHGEGQYNGNGNGYSNNGGYRY